MFNAKTTHYAQPKVVHTHAGVRPNKQTKHIIIEGYVERLQGELNELRCSNRRPTHGEPTGFGFLRNPRTLGLAGGPMFLLNKRPG